MRHVLTVRIDALRLGGLQRRATKENRNLICNIVLCRLTINREMAFLPQQ